MRIYEAYTLLFLERLLFVFSFSMCQNLKSRNTNEYNITCSTI